MDKRLEDLTQQEQRRIKSHWNICRTEWEHGVHVGKLTLCRERLAERVGVSLSTLYRFINRPS